MRVSMFNSAELQAVVLTVRSFDRDLRTNVRKVTRILTTGEWAAQVRGEASTRLENRVLADTARVQVSDRTVILKAAGIGRRLKGGARPPEVFAGTEFGAFPKVEPVVMVSRKGRRFTAKRNINQQFRPRKRTGYAVYPAAAKFIPRAAALWAQTTVRTFYEAFEMRGR